MAFFGVPLLIPGLILLLAGPTWFHGAATVGWILVIAGAVPLIIVLVLLILAALAAILAAVLDR